MPLLTPEDLLDPKGALVPSVLWPRKSATVYREWIKEYLADGYRQAALDVVETDSVNEAARQWAYWRAYDKKYRAMVMLPSTVELRNEASSSTLVTQINLMGELAAQALAAYQVLLPSVQAAVVQPPMPSRPAPITTVW